MSEFQFHFWLLLVHAKWWLTYKIRETKLSSNRNIGMLHHWLTLIVVKHEFFR